MNALAYWILTWLPGGWRGEPWKTLELWLLPYAVAWAYRDEVIR